MATGCVLSLIAMFVAFLLLFPINYMNWPGFSAGAIHAGGWIVVWWVLFFISYVLLLAIDRWLRARSKRSKREE